MQHQLSDKQCHGIVKSKMTLENPTTNDRCKLKALKDDCLCQYHQKQRNKASVFMYRIKSYISKVHTVETLEQYNIANDIYDCVLGNIQIIHKNPQFKKTVINKAHELSNSGWPNATYYIDKLQKEEISIEEYNKMLNS